MLLNLKQISLLVLLSLCSFSKSAPTIYYVIPENGNCTVGNKVCYTLNQLNQVLPSSKGDSVELLFLNGTHLIQDGQNLNFSDFSEVTICPYNEDQKVEIKCSSVGKDKIEADIIIQAVTKLNMISVNFYFLYNTCTLWP